MALSCMISEIKRDIWSKIAIFHNIKLTADTNRLIFLKTHLQRVSKNRIATVHMTQLHQFTTFTNYFWQRETLFNSELTMLKVFKLA